MGIRKIKEKKYIAQINMITWHAACVKVWEGQEPIAYMDLDGDHAFLWEIYEYLSAGWDVFHWEKDGQIVLTGDTYPIQRMNKMQRQITEFHKEFEVLAPDKPTMPSLDVRILRKRLMKEELQELIDAMYDEDMVEIADGIADLLVVTFGTAVSYGINIEPIFNEIHRSNMTKRWKDGSIHHDEYGKVIKSPDYEPAIIEPLLKEQGWKKEKA